MILILDGSGFSSHVLLTVDTGEVIIFAADAVETMGKDGLFVLLEGREQTVSGFDARGR